MSHTVISPKRVACEAFVRGQCLLAESDCVFSHNPLLISVNLKEGSPSLQFAARKLSNADEIPCCAICDEDLEAASHQKELSCGHTYHTECIQKWFVKNHTCPICRSPAY